MARITPIRISANDKTEYARLVRNTRAKISRTKKKYNIDLSNEVTLPSLDSFSTRKQFNLWKERQASFTNPHNLNYQFVKNKYGVVATKKQVNKIERDNKIAINRAKREVAKYEKKYPAVEKKVQHFTEAPVLGIHIPKKFDFSKVRHKDRLKSVEENMEKRKKPDYFDARMVTMQENFIKSVEGSFNSEADELVEMLRALSPDDFYDLYIRDEVGDFEFEVWDSEGQFVGANEGHIQRMVSMIKKYNNNELNNDLKGF